MAERSRLKIGRRIVGKNSSTVGVETIPVVREEIQIKVEEPDFESIASTNPVLDSFFSKEKFYSLWEVAAPSIYNKVEGILSKGFAYYDVLSHMEESIHRESIDPNLVLLDEKLEKEVESAIHLKLLFVFIDELFEGEDITNVKQYLLTPKVSGNVRPQFSKDDWIKELLDIKRGLKSKPTTPEKEGEIGVKKSRKKG